MKQISVIKMALFTNTMAHGTSDTASESRRGWFLQPQPRFQTIWGAPKTFAYISDVELCERHSFAVYCSANVQQKTIGFPSF